MSALNEQYHVKYAGSCGKSRGVFVGNYYYRFKNRGFNNYSIHAKIPIVGHEKKIQRLEAGDNA